MADELKERVSMAYAKGGLTAAIAELQFAVTCTDTAVFHNTIKVGTSQEAIPKGDVTPTRIVGFCRTSGQTVDFAARAADTDVLRFAFGEPNSFGFAAAGNPVVSASAVDTLFEYYLFG